MKQNGSLYPCQSAHINHNCNKLSSLIGYQEALFSVAFIWLDNLQFIWARCCRTVALEWLPSLKDLEDLFLAKKVTPFYILTLFSYVLL